MLRIIEDRSPKVGQFVAGLLGLAWALASFLVIPVLVVENKGPFAALTESSRLLLRKTWGDQLVGNFGFGLLGFLLSLPALVLLGVGVMALGAGHSVPLGVACIALGIIGLIGVCLFNRPFSRFSRRPCSLRPRQPRPRLPARVDAGCHQHQVVKRLLCRMA